MLENANYTTLDQLGEFGLIDHLTRNIKLTNESTVKGVGDDAAVIDPGAKQVVMSTDMLVEGIHFDMVYSPLKHLGYKAIAVNLSDIFAMNAKPTQVVVSLAVSSRYTLEALEEFYNGMQLACEKYGVDLVGGDTTSIPTGLVISITATGLADKDDVVLRSGAAEHDLICVSGDLGAAFMGLQVLQREKVAFQAGSTKQPDLDGYDYLLERQLKPEPRADMVRLFADLGIKPTSMIDISDGLASELLHLAKASDLGVSVYEQKIPLDPVTVQAVEEFKLDPNTVALNGGEDYELLFTLKQADYDKIEFREDMHVIGHMTAKGSANYLIGAGGDTIELKAQGWNAFAAKNG